MEKVLLLSDLHVGAEPDAEAGLQAVLEHALSRHGDARAIIVPGDMTHDGKPAQYRILAGMLARVSIPVIPMTGNHDRRAALLAAFPQAVRTPQGHVQTVLDIHRHRIITLDTLDGPPYAGHRHGGRLCPDRIAWLMRALEGAGDRHVAVIAHHPPFKIGAPGQDAIRLDDGAALLELLAACPGALLICGHLHRAASGLSRGVAWASLGSCAHPFALSLDDDEVRPGMQLPSYGVLLLQKHGFCLHHQEMPR